MQAKESFVYVAGDDDLLKQLLVNLIINSCEAIGDRSGRVDIGISTSSTGAVSLVVSDDGPGISAEQMDHIFEPFYSTKKDGTGLGLAIVQRICSLLKLSIAVQSRPNFGTTFRVEFPQIDRAEDTRQRSAATPVAVR